MILIILILISATFLGGFSIRFFGSKAKNIQLPLVFAGSYLFAITIMHILPELFSHGEDALSIGIFILLGFFIQQLIEYLTSGAEHGHFHHNSGKNSVLLGLVLHSILEGTILKHDIPFHGHSETYPILVGIVLHKIPAALALMAVYQNRGFRQQMVYLGIFSIASPIGLLISEYAVLNSNYLFYLFAMVAGSFLHISTTIFVETSPDHHFNWGKFVIGVLGATLAILSEYFI